MKRTSSYGGRLLLFALLVAASSFSCYYGWPTIGPLQDFSRPPDLLLAFSIKGLNGCYDVSWSPDGSALAFSCEEGVFRLDRPSRNVVQILGLEQYARAVWLTWSPQGDRIAFVRWSRAPENSGGVYVIRPDGNGLSRISERKGGAIWSPTGEWIALCSWDGVWVVRSDGREERLLTGHRCEDFVGPCKKNLSWSPDGQKIAFVTVEGDPESLQSNREIYVVDLNNLQVTNVSRSPSWDYSPSWSPDGKKIAFNSDRAGQEDIWLVNADGSDPVNLTRTRRVYEFCPAWSPDGSKFAFIVRGQLWVLGSDGTSRRLLVDPRICNFKHYTWSPGSEWLAGICQYTSHPPSVAFGSQVYLIRVRP